MTPWTLERDEFKRQYSRILFQFSAFITEIPVLPADVHENVQKRKDTSRFFREECLIL